MDHKSSSLTARGHPLLPQRRPIFSLRFCAAARQMVESAMPMTAPWRSTTTPSSPKRGEIAATLHGDLGTILEWAAQKQNTPGRDGSGVSVSVVAGRGFEPLTFRL
jgi:hypothetical protein